MKVLLIAPYGNVTGGIARWTGHILDYYKNNGRQSCEMVLLPQTRSEFIVANTPILHRITSGVRDYLKIINSLRTIIKEQRFDLIHLTTSATLGLLKDIYILWYCKRRKIKTVIHFRFGRIPNLISSNNWEWKLLKKTLLYADRVIVIDKHSYNCLVGLGYTNIVYLPNPISSNVYNIVSKYQIERKPRTVTYCGHVIPTKGVFELVEACKKIKNIELRLVGYVEPSIKEQLEELSEHGNWLVMTGNQDYEQTIKEMLSCDVFCLPSYTEGFPNVILEAMACSCPIIATKVGAIPEMLEKEKGKQYGVLISPRSSSELYTAIETMLNNELLKLECGTNARVRVYERYSIDSIWEELERIWLSAMG